MKTNLLTACSRLCILSLAGLAATALAQETPLHDTAYANAASKVTHSDRSFIEDAVKAGREEVAISQVAVERAVNPKVKQFAQMIVDDHTGVNSELATLATAKGINLPTKEVDVEKWSKKSGKSFDEDYIEKMVSAHKDALDLFSKEAKKGGDAELTALAGKTVAALQTHLAKAQELKKMFD
jgi:putative membrane protein